jgi:hypothetical protein
MQSRLFVILGVALVVIAAVLSFRQGPSRIVAVGDNNPAPSSEHRSSGVASRANDEEWARMARPPNDREPVRPSEAYQTGGAEVKATNRLAGLLEEGQEIEVAPEVIARWLAINKTNAGGLLAAAQVGHDRSLYLTALTNFPNDPRVLFAVAGPDRLPEQRRELLDRLQAAAPENALADYLSARDHMKNGRTMEALDDLVEATGKTRFNDYTLEDLQNREDLLLQAGKSPAEAKALATSSTLLPHLSQMKALAQDMAGLQKQYLAAGDTASAEHLAQIGLQMAEHLTAGEGGSCLINNLVGYAVERIVISPLDQQTSYSFLNGTVPDRIEQLQAQRAAAKQSTQLFDQWWRTATEAEIISYFDRVKLYGESAALGWLQSRYGQ